MMDYFYVPVTGLVHVQFNQFRLAHNAAVFEQNFAGRDLRLDEWDRWTDLWCTMNEWQGYLEKGKFGALTMQNAEMVRFFELELTIFRQWCSQIGQTPFYKIGMSEGIQA